MGQKPTFTLFLGGLRYNGNLENVDVNTLMDTGIYFLTDGCTNIPEGWGTVVVFKANGRVLQLYYKPESSHFKSLLWRQYHGTLGWSSWYQNYDESILTNSTLLGPLASALGVGKIVATNDISIGVICAKSSNTDGPTSDDWWTIYYFPLKGTNYCLEFAHPSLDRNNPRLFFRYVVSGGTTSQWKEL